jgi:hypothetical protein
MDNIINKDLYKKAKEKADETYKKHSAYKSMYIQKVYKELGGKYKGKKNKEGVKRWNKEEWIQVKPYLESGKKLVCGGSERQNKVCRPLKRINDKSPITIEELLKLHPKKDLIKLANKKIKDMKGRVYWKTLKFIPSN